MVINSISAQRFHCLLMPACSGRQSAESPGTFDACREKSFRLPQGDAKKVREGERGGDQTRRAVTLPRTPDSAFYFPPHVLFRGHFVLFGSSLWGLIAQLMSGDAACWHTSASELWSFGVELLVQCLNWVHGKVQSTLLHSERSNILICLWLNC